MAPEQPKPSLPQQLEDIYTRTDRSTGGRLGIVRQTIDRYAATRATQASAAISYYTLFSLFPLALVFLTALSLFIDPQQAEVVLKAALLQLLPESPSLQQFLLDTVSSVFALRGEVTVVSLLALIWSASSAFTTLTFNIDLAWLQETRPNPLKARLVGLLMIAVVYVILLVLLVGGAVLSLFAALPLSVLDQLGLPEEVARNFGVRGMGVLLSIAVFFALYWWVPSKKAPWSAALLAALFAALASLVVDAGFSFYLSSRFARYELVYGPIASIIMLMVWFYLRITIILFGAHLSASLARYREGRAR
jgi:membrane protein